MFDEGATIEGVSFVAGKTLLGSAAIIDLSSLDREVQTLFDITSSSPGHSTDSRSSGTLDFISGHVFPSSSTFKVMQGANAGST